MLFSTSVYPPLADHTSISLLLISWWMLLKRKLNRSIHILRRRNQRCSVPHAQPTRIQRSELCRALCPKRCVPGKSAANGNTGLKTPAASSHGCVKASPARSELSRSSRNAICPGVCPGEQIARSDPTWSPSFKSRVGCESMRTNPNSFLPGAPVSSDKSSARSRASREPISSSSPFVARIIHAPLLCDHRPNPVDLHRRA
jgi:hypothetical protein